MIKISKFILLTLIFSFSFCASNKNNHNPENLNERDQSNSCKIIPSSSSENFERDSNLIKTQPLLPHLLKQQAILKQTSSHSDTSLTPDGEYLIGRFDCGVIELEIKRIDGEPAYVYGLVNGHDSELEFLIYGIDSDTIEDTIIGNKYKIHWVETICLMEPYDDGYQRTYIAYKIE